MIQDWRYYNRAAIPVCAPHEVPDLGPIHSGAIFSGLPGGKPLLARWTSEWDSGYERQWWYVIKDTPFDISALKSKRRYEINKGNKNFSVRRIAPSEFGAELYRVTCAAFSAWPEKYRPSLTREAMDGVIAGWADFDVFGAFGLEDGRLGGYAVVEDHGSYAAFSILRADPGMERLAVNAALVNGILAAYADRLRDGFYINDGARAIRHETAFQDYLEKYFGFRKAYCRLNICYRRDVRFIVNALYPFRRLITGKTGIGSSVCGILKMEELRRTQEKQLR